MRPLCLHCPVCFYCCVSIVKSKLGLLNSSLKINSKEINEKYKYSRKRWLLFQRLSTHTHFPEHMLQADKMDKGKVYLRDTAVLKQKTNEEYNS